MREADALLLGRITYEESAAAWPRAARRPMTGASPRKLNAMPKYVVHHAERSAVESAHVLSGDVANAVAQLMQSARDATRPSAAPTP